MKMFRFLFGLAVLGLVASVSFADCPNCKKAAAQARPAMSGASCECMARGLPCVCSPSSNCGCMSVAGYVWRQSEDDAGYWGLYKNGIQVAGYDEDFDEYRTYNRATDTWGPKTAPPWPKTLATVPSKVKNFGNNYQPVEQQSPAKVKYRIKGKPASREDAIDTIRSSAVVAPGAAPKLPDDSTRLRVTSFGANREVVDRDMATAPALVALKDKVVYKSYDTVRDWEADGFKATGSPTISIEDPQTRRELHRQNDYTGPDSLALAIVSAEAQRKADPNFDPAKSPDLRNGMDSVLANPDVGSALTAGGIFAAIAMALRGMVPAA